MSRTLPEPFTMAEYIEFHKLRIRPNDIPSVRLISDHLRAKGFVRRKVRRRGETIIGWRHQADRKELVEALSKIK